MTLRLKPFENTVGKGENAVNQHFSRYPTMFFTPLETFLNLSCAFFVVCKCFEFGLV